MNSIQAPNLSLEYYQTQIANHTSRIQTLNAAIATLKNESPAPEPFSSRKITSLRLAMKIEKAQKATIKTLLGELSFLRHGAVTGKRKQITINSSVQVRPMPKRHSAQYQAEASAPVIIHNTDETLLKLLSQGREAHERDDDSAAHAYYREAIEHNGNDYRAYLERALLYFSEDDFSKAFSYCEEGLWCDPSNHDLIDLKDEILKKMD